MPDPIKISSDKYNKKGKVDIDGKIWSVKLPGARTEMVLSQAFRASKLHGARIDLIDKKITTETATEADLEKYEEACEKYTASETSIYNFLAGMFKDETPDNSEVKKWLDETPTAVVMMAFEDIKNNANGTAQVTAPENTEGTDGSGTTPASN